MLLAGLLCQLRCFFFSLRGGAFSLARAGLEQTGCCVGAQRALCGRCPQEGLCRARVQVCGELVNEFFLTTAGQQLLMHQGKLPGCSSAVWSELGVCVGERRGTEFGAGSSLTGFPPPLRAPPPVPRSLYLLYAAGLLSRALQLSLQPLIVPLQPGVLPQYCLHLDQVGTAHGGLGTCRSLHCRWTEGAWGTMA